MAVASVGLKNGGFARLACKALENGSLQSAAFSAIRREAHTSTTNYSSSDTDEVNLDCDSIKAALNAKPVEQHEISAKTVAPVLPDAVVMESETETFWAPNPETGVFAPAADESEIDVNGSLPAPPHPTENGSSILDQTVWVREIEVEAVEKPPPSIADKPPTDLMEKK